MEPQEKKRNVRGVSVRSANLAMIVLSTLLYAALLAVSFHVDREYKEMKAATDLYIACQEDAALVSAGSDYLTEQVRLFVVTLNPEYMENYFHEIHVDRRRDLALEQLSDKATENAKTYLSQALERSNQLMELEIYAMRLVAEAQGISGLPQEVDETELFPGHKVLSDEEKVELARDKVFGEEYLAKKSLVNDNVTAFINDIMSATQYSQETSTADLSRAMTTQRVVFSLLFLQNVFIFVMIIFLIVKPLQVYVKCIKEDKSMEVTGAYEFKYLALTYNDIHELNATNEILLRHQSEHDALTGILNRGAFDQVRKVLHAKPRPIALLLVDVDLFKQVNDGYGHETGDKVLKKVAHMLEENFRASDFPARIGGDEFAVIMDEVGPEKQTIISQKMQEMNRQLARPRDGLPSVSISVGGAFSPDGFTDELYRRADAALHTVKTNGRKGCRFYQPGDTIKNAD